MLFAYRSSWPKPLRPLPRILCPGPGAGPAGCPGPTSSAPGAPLHSGRRCRPPIWPRAWHLRTGNVKRMGSPAQCIAAKGNKKSPFLPNACKALSKCWWCTTGKQSAQMWGLLVLQRLSMALSPCQMTVFKRQALGRLKNKVPWKSLCQTLHPSRCDPGLQIQGYKLFFFPEGELSHRGAGRGCR